MYEMSDIVPSAPTYGQLRQTMAVPISDHGDLHDAELFKDVVTTPSRRRRRAIWDPRVELELTAS